MTLTLPRKLMSNSAAHGRTQQLPFVFTIVLTHDSTGKVDGLIIYGDDTAGAQQ